MCGPILPPEAPEEPHELGGTLPTVTIVGLSFSAGANPYLSADSLGRRCQHPASGPVGGRQSTLHGQLRPEDDILTCREVQVVDLAIAEDATRLPGQTGNVDRGSGDHPAAANHRPVSTNAGLADIAAAVGLRHVVPFQSGLCPAARQEPCQLPPSPASDLARGGLKQLLDPPQCRQDPGNVSPSC